MNDKQYLIFNTQRSFEEALAGEKIRKNAIVFIKETGRIWTHGAMFGGESEHSRGFYGSYDKLPTDGKQGDWAVVGEDGQWFVYYYNASLQLWEKGDEYEFPDFLGDLYVKKEDIWTYTKDIYDSVYVRKDELYNDDESEHSPEQIDQPGYDPSAGSGGGSYTGPRHVILNQAAYDALSSYDNNAIYFIVNSQNNTNWAFGDTFPIRFSEDWAFGGVFPITLK